MALEDTDSTLFWSKTQACLLSSMKDSRSLSSEFFSCNSTHPPCMQQSSDPLGKTSSEMLILWLLLMLSSKLSFVPDPGVSCPLLAFMKCVRQTFKLMSKISDPSQFLTTRCVALKMGLKQLVGLSTS